MLHLKKETYPSPLKKGDCFQIVAASSTIEDEVSINSGIEILESWGLICIKTNIVGRSWGYLAGDDETRFNELHPSENYPLQVFARGGWGAARLLEKTQPWKKGWLLGYSDVSSILLSRLSKGFYGGIHGPLLTSLSSEPEWSQERLKSILFGKKVPDLHGEPWHRGIAKGPVISTNLSVMTHLLGSSHIPIFKDSILIIEDIGEAPYKIDRMLTQLRLSGLLHQLAGLGIGSFTNCIDIEQQHNPNNFNLDQVLKDRTKDLEFPIVCNLPIGHCKGNGSLHLGELAIINGARGSISFLP